jgi:hypothetical protein
MKLKYQNVIKWALVNNRIQHLLIDGDLTFSKKRILINIGLNFIIIPIIILLSIFTSAKIIAIYLKQFTIHCTHIDSNIDVIMLKTGRGYDHENILRNIDGVSVNSISIQAFNLGCFMEKGRVSFFSLLASLVQSLYDYYFLLKLSPSIGVSRLLITSSIDQIVSYVYLLSFFQKVKRDNPHCKVYSGGAINACNAAINSGLKAIYMYHGMLERYYYQAIPNFSSIYVYSLDEKNYLKKLGVNCPVYVYHYDEIKEYTNSIIIFAPINKTHLIEIVKLFSSYRCKVYVKQHPYPGYHIDEDGVLAKCENINIEFISNNVYKDARSVINDIKPKLVFGGISTALCEALNMGVLPVNVENKTKEYYRVKSILAYNFDLRCLSWESDKAMLKDIVLNQFMYKKNLSRLKI